MKLTKRSSEETTTLILQLLHTLASSQEGAKAFVSIEDITPLTEVASKYASVLDILTFAWLNAMTAVENSSVLARQVDVAIQSLVSIFRGTDAVTLLEFLGYFLRNADSKVCASSLSSKVSSDTYIQIIPPNPKWLDTIITYIQNLVTGRPTPEARSAYTNAAASLLQTYRAHAPKLIFTSRQKDEKAFSYLFINLLLIDIRISAPTLLEQLNRPEYPKTSRRLASAFDVISIFIGYLIQCLEDDSSDIFPMPPDNLLKLRKGISETMSVTIEYLRDRWDASVAGAMGLHPEAIIGTSKTVSGSHHTLAWDSMKDHADEDMFILSAVRTLALWLREEDNDSMRKETTGLMDMFMDLYRSSSQEKLDFRSPILVALEGITTLTKGRASLLEHDGWSVLTKDLLTILPSSQSTAASRGIDIVRILLPLVDEESGGIPEEWMDLITGVAAWAVPTSKDEIVLEFQVAVLQLCCAILARAGAGMRKRYAHSIAAVNGIANVLGKRASKSKDLDESLEDVVVTLAALRVNST